MATESVSGDIATRIESMSCAIDGVAAIVGGIAAGEQSAVESAAFACRDLLMRITADLDDVANLIRFGEDAEGEQA